MSCHRGDVCAANEVRSVCILGLNFQFKDGAYFYYCAYVLRISRYSGGGGGEGFLYVVPTNTGIFLHGLKLCGESRT